MPDPTQAARTVAGLQAVAGLAHDRLDAVPDGMAVRDARRVVQRLAAEPGGTVCPVCDALAVVRDRTMGTGPTMCFLWLYQATRRGEAGYVRVKDRAPRRVVAAREFDKGALFGLCEQDPETPGDWRLTERGRAFAEGRVKIPASVSVFRGEVVATADDSVSLDDLAARSGGVRFYVREFRAGVTVGDNPLPK